jgi:hypothetical protein
MIPNHPSPNEPQEIRVNERDGKPRALLYKNRFTPVKEILNIWRIDDEWWRRPISRLYFSVELATGTRVTVFHDLVGGGWYRQHWM